MLRTTTIIAFVNLAVYCGLLAPILAQEAVEGANPNVAANPLDELGDRYYVYGDKLLEFGPALMPDGDVPVSQSFDAKGKPRNGVSFYRIKVDLAQNHAWAAAVLIPGGAFDPVRKVNVADKLDLKSGDKVVLRFWARSLTGDTIQFKVGGYGEDSIDFAKKTKWLKLSGNWQLVTVDLSDSDVTGLRGALTWTVDRDHSGEKRVEFDLDEIYFVRLSAEGAK